MPKLPFLLTLALLMTAPVAPQAAEHTRYRINEPAGWTLTPNVDELPLDTTVYLHPLGGRLMIRLTPGESTLQAETALVLQLVKEGGVELVGEPLWDQTTKIAGAIWQKTLNGKVAVKGAILVGPAPNAKTPLLFAYVGGWKADLDEQFGPLLAKAFNERGLTPLD